MIRGRPSEAGYVPCPHRFDEVGAQGRNFLEEVKGSRPVEEIKR